MTIIEFTEKFPTEESCKKYFRDVRMQQGVVCKKCQCSKHYWLKGKWQFQCSACGFRTTLRSGTVMENSRLSFKKWLLIMLFMTSTKKGFSACEIQRQLGHKRYNTILDIMHRIRKVMGKRDDLYNLSDMIEFDEGHFETEVPAKVRAKLKRGRGSQRQANVAVMAESICLEDINTGERTKQCRYFKMKVLENFKSEAVNSVVKSSVDEDAIIFSDNSTSYFDISKYVEMHLVEKSNNETTKETLKWVHIAISNAKRNFLGVYHKIKRKYLQNYLNEFVYKLNRRYFSSIFERLVVASVYWYTTD